MPRAEEARDGPFGMAGLWSYPRLAHRRSLGLRGEQFRKRDLVDDRWRLLEQFRHVGATVGFHALGPDALHEGIPDLGERPCVGCFGIQQLEDVPAIVEPDRLRGRSLCQSHNLAANLGPQVRFSHPADLAIPLGGRRVVGNAAGERAKIGARLLQLLHDVVELLARGILGRLVGVLCQGDNDLSQLKTPGDQKCAGIGVVDALDIGLARVVLGGTETELR